VVVSFVNSVRRDRASSSTLERVVRHIWRTLRCQFIRYDEIRREGWRATFYTTGMEHSPTSATGTGWEPTPWHATQRAAWEAMNQGRLE
jgi:hypothetical protein